MSTEKWMTIKDFPMYEVSNQGRVRNTATDQLKETFMRGRHVTVTLYKGGLKQNLRLARLVAVHFVANPDKHPAVTHMDRNPLNNQACNLRWGSLSSICITKPKKTGQSIFKGVSPRGEGKWRAVIKFQGKFIEIGTFKTEEEAGIAYNKKAKELYGDFAVLNTVH